jgi:hypothetical protein
MAKPSGLPQQALDNAAAQAQSHLRRFSPGGGFFLCRKKWNFDA